MEAKGLFVYWFCKLFHILKNKENKKKKQEEHVLFLMCSCFEKHR